MSPVCVMLHGKFTVFSRNEIIVKGIDIIRFTLIVIRPIQQRKCPDIHLFLTYADNLSHHQAILHKYER